MTFPARSDRFAVALWVSAPLKMTRGERGRPEDEWCCDFVANDVVLRTNDVAIRQINVGRWHKVCEAYLPAETNGQERPHHIIKAMPKNSLPLGEGGPLAVDEAHVLRGRT